MPTHQRPDAKFVRLNTDSLSSISRITAVRHMAIKFVSKKSDNRHQSSCLSLHPAHPSVACLTTSALVVSASAQPHKLLSPQRATCDYPPNFCVDQAVWVLKRIKFNDCQNLTHRSGLPFTKSYDPSVKRLGKLESCKAHARRE